MKRILVLVAFGLALIAATSIAAHATGNWCYTHECKGTLDSGPPYLTHDGDGDSDDKAGQGGGITHVVLIMEENHNRTAALSGMPYLKSLTTTYATAPSYTAITHPSLPNYFAITGGSTFGSSSDHTQHVSADNIYHQQGSSWAQWSDGMPKPCDGSDGGASYVVHHAIAPFYTDLSATCPANDRPVTSSTIPAITAKFTFLTPSNIHNAHSASLAAADAWLKTVMGNLMADPAYKDGSTLIEVAFDEGSSGNQNVATAFVNPSLHSVTVSGNCNHYSMLRLNEELLSEPLLGAAKTAPDIRAKLGL